VLRRAKGPSTRGRDACNTSQLWQGTSESARQHIQQNNCKGHGALSTGAEQPH